MEINILTKIKSKYIIQNIFSLIQENIKYKLVNYSKLSQEKLDLKLTDYKNLHFYYKNIGKIDWQNYLCFHNYKEGPGKEEDIKEKYETEFLKAKLQNDLCKYNFDLSDYRIKKGLIIFFKNYVKKNNYIEIDLYSPLFDILLKEKNFLSRFIIQIPLYRFRDFNSSKFNAVISDFNKKLNIFNELNKSRDINYSLAIINIIDIDFIKKLNIDINSVINLKLYLLNINDYGTEYILQEKINEYFRNLNNITIIIKDRYFYTANNLFISDFILEENVNSAIKNIKIDMDDTINRLKLYCHSFKTLESIDLFLCEIPITKFFNNKSSVIFQSLYKFHFSYIYLPSKEDLIQVCNNLDNMPNLIDLKLKFGKYINLKKKYTFDENFENNYETLIRKVLYKKTIKIINISIFAFPKSHDLYSQTELIKKFPNLNFNSFYQVNIEKLNNNNLCNII